MQTHEMSIPVALYRKKVLWVYLPSSVEGINMEREDWSIVAHIVAMVTSYSMDDGFLYVPVYSMYLCVRSK